jgi:hypothetical protein
MFEISFTSQEKHKGTDSNFGIDYNHEQRFAEYEIEDVKKLKYFVFISKLGKVFHII